MSHYRGEVPQEELKARDIARSAFTMKIGVYPSHFSDILKRKRRLNAAVALKPEHEWNTSAGFWVGLQAEYELFKERERNSK